MPIILRDATGRCTGQVDATAPGYYTLRDATGAIVATVEAVGAGDSGRWVVRGTSGAIIGEAEVPVGMNPWDEGFGEMLMGELVAGGHAVAALGMGAAAEEFLRAADRPVEMGTATFLATDAAGHEHKGKGEGGGQFTGSGGDDKMQEFVHNAISHKPNRKAIASEIRRLGLNETEAKVALQKAWGSQPPRVHAMTPEELEAHRQRSAAGVAKSQAARAREQRLAVPDAEIAGNFKSAHDQLLASGATLDAESESGSRYYTLADGSKLRLGDHPATEATQAWLDKHDGSDIRVDRRSWQGQLKEIIAPPGLDLSLATFLAQGSLWEEGAHPRGQPENAGELVAGGHAVAALGMGAAIPDVTQLASRNIPTIEKTGTMEECSEDGRGHGRFFCRCGKMIRQCRCMHSADNPHRVYHVTDKPCVKCKSIPEVAELATAGRHSPKGGVDIKGKQEKVPEITPTAASPAPTASLTLLAFAGSGTGGAVNTSWKRDVSRRGRMVWTNINNPADKRYQEQQPGTRGAGDGAGQQGQGGAPATAPAAPAVPTVTPTGPPAAPAKKTSPTAPRSRPSGVTSTIPLITPTGGGGSNGAAPTAGQRGTGSPAAPAAPPAARKVPTREDVEKVGWGDIVKEWGHQTLEAILGKFLNPTRLKRVLGPYAGMHTAAAAMARKGATVGQIDKYLQREGRKRGIIPPEPEAVPEVNPKTLQRQAAKAQMDQQREQDKAARDAAMAQRQTERQARIEQHKQQSEAKKAQRDQEKAARDAQRAQDKGNRQPRGPKVEAVPETPPPPKVGNAPEAAPRGATPGVAGADTMIRSEGFDKPIPARYEVREMADVRSSHRYDTGVPQPDADYPKGLQPREYTLHGAEDKKVRRIAEAGEPGYLVTEHPDATNGAPVITENGAVINGNGRAMGLQLAAHQGKYDWYKNDLLAKANRFGIDPEKVKGMKHPVLVRVVGMDQNGKDAQAFARGGNVSTTESQSPVRTAASLGGLVNDEVMNSLKLGEDSTFSEAVSDPSRGRAFRERLKSSLPPTEASRYFTPENQLTEAGKELTRAMLLNKVFPVETIEKLGEEKRGLKRTLEAAIPQMLKLNRDFPQFNVAGSLTNAVNFLAKHPEASSPASADNIMAQQVSPALGGKADPVERQLVHFMIEHGNNAGAFRKGLQGIVAGLNDKTGMFGESVPDVPELAAESLRGAKGQGQGQGQPPAPTASPVPSITTTGQQGQQTPTAKPAPPAASPSATSTAPAPTVPTKPSITTTGQPGKAPVPARAPAQPITQDDKRKAESSVSARLDVDDPALKARLLKGPDAVYADPHVKQLLNQYRGTPVERSLMSIIANRVKYAQATAGQQRGAGGGQPAPGTPAPVMGGAGGAGHPGGSGQAAAPVEITVSMARRAIPEVVYLGTGAHKYATTQVDIPLGVAQHLREYGLMIPREDLCVEEGDRGRETRFHSTLLYGLLSSDPACVRAVLANEPPIRIRLGETSIFAASGGRDFDVLKIDVHSHDLRRLHRRIAAACPHFDKFKGYRPHLTIAYVAKGSGKKYAGDRRFAGRVVIIDEVVFSDQAGRKTRIRLTGRRSVAVPAPKRAAVTMAAARLVFAAVP